MASNKGDASKDLLVEARTWRIRKENLRSSGMESS